MRFQLPQFIDTEIKIIGPLTLKQFIWIGSGTVLIFFFITVLKNIWALLISVPIAIFSLAFAFVKIDQVPLVNYATYWLSYVLNPKKYVYRNPEQGTIDIPIPENKNG